jgi:hypothetical protein
MFRRWQLNRRHGGRPPRGLEEVLAYEDLDAIAQEVERERCPTPT